MKNFIILFILAAVFLSACSTKFKVGAPYKEVTVVYGLLSVTDTAHYIKISKGFYDESMNNLELAKNTDSIYFNNLNVEMQVMNGANVIETISLYRVDLNLEGYVKEPGTFGTSPNYAYKFKKNLNANYVYKLKVKNLSSGKEIEGQTPLISNVPSSFQLIQPLNSFNYELDFSNPSVPYPFLWDGPSTAAFYDVAIKFKYQEVDVITEDTIYVVKEIPLVQNIPATTGETAASLRSVDFFKQLNSYISAAPLNIKRYVDTPDLMVLAGGYELKTYIDVNAAQGGITYDQIKPNYTNLKGENVFGLLSTRGQIILPRIKFSAATIDSIRNGMFTKNLRIVGISSQ